MAKKIRSTKIKSSSDVNKNSGIKISHTISKIQENERKYTFYLTAVFMVLIVAFAYMFFSVDSSSVASLDYTMAYQHLSSSGKMVYMNEDNIMSDEEGLVSEPVFVNFSNMTNHTINYVIKFVEEKDMVENCKCEIVDYKKIKFSVDGEHVQTFDNEDMIVTSGMLKSNNEDILKVHFWIDDDMPEDSECNYYGRFVFQEFNEMKLED